MATTLKGRTGQGCVVTLAGSAFNACVRSITLPNWTQEKIDITCIEDKGYQKFIAGDITDPGECTVTMLWAPNDDIGDDSADAVPGDLIVGKADTLTITFPSYSADVGGGGGGSLSGTGFITSLDLPDLSVNSLLEYSFTFCFDGFTGPVWTAGSAGS